MKLSIVIVNYNVKYFLEQCLLSVRSACKNIEAEVIVVDNNSVDHSLEMLDDKFQDIILIANKENVGFSKANNQGIRIAKGKYILLLNPDTLVEEDTFSKCISFMDEHPEAGGLGVKMLDGKGRFLKESKRGLPTPMAAFYKMFGFSTLFPHSKVFSAYHKGHIPQDQIAEIEILSGAYMWMRKSVLDQVGLLDESFFMYGEDIDLSYRIIQGGYKNYYFPQARIIHYKGESTKKDTVNYVYVFYNAMIIFARKHYSSKSAKIFSALINVAIVFRAMVSLLISFSRRVFVPLLDFGLIFSSLLILAHFWAPQILGNDQFYPAFYLYGLLPSFVLLWQLIGYYSGIYDEQVRFYRFVLSQFLATVLTLAVYSLLPEEIRYSRAMILLGAPLGLLVMILWRSIGFKLGFKKLKIGERNTNRVAIVGGSDEAVRVADLLSTTEIQSASKALILNEMYIKSKSISYEILGGVHQLDEIIQIHKINELIFCAKNFSAYEIINMMSRLKSGEMEFKIAPSEQMFIIGSNSINTASDVYLIDLNNINKKANQRFKRLFDFLLSLVLLGLSPVLMWIYVRPFHFVSNVLKCLMASKSWVGFNKFSSNLQLPKIKPSVLFAGDLSLNQNESELTRLNLLYARNYSIGFDISVVWKSLKKLDR
jgi:GT2 family glycosyltransferase